MHVHDFTNITSRIAIAVIVLARVTTAEHFIPDHKSFGAINTDDNACFTVDPKHAAAFPHAKLIFRMCPLYQVTLRLARTNCVLIFFGHAMAKAITFDTSFIFFVSTTECAFFWKDAHRARCDAAKTTSSVRVNVNPKDFVGVEDAC
jgi:hypothetical protein